MKDQDRSLWNREMIIQGLDYLYAATETDSISSYHILATISANHCIAVRFSDTNWGEILSLYDSLLKIEDSPMVRLNRAVAVSHVHGNLRSIDELLALQLASDIGSYYLFHSTIGELYRREKMNQQAKTSFELAIQLARNIRDRKVMEKKLHHLVPIL